MYVYVQRNNDAESFILWEDSWIIIERKFSMSLFFWLWIKYNKAESINIWKRDEIELLGIFLRVTQYLFIGCSISFCSLLGIFLWFARYLSIVFSVSFQGLLGKFSSVVRIFCFIYNHWAELWLRIIANFVCNALVISIFDVARKKWHYLRARRYLFEKVPFLRSFTL